MARGRKLAIIVAVEGFSDPKIRPVQYAENDATKINQTLRGQGWETIMLINQGATKTTIRCRLRKVLQRLGPDDTFCIFFATHGFSENGRNYLLAHDSQSDDLTGTSLSLQWIFGLLKRSACLRCILFVDSCETGVEMHESMRGHLAELSDDQLRQSFEQAEYCVGFAACKSDQKSHASPRLRHGIWTHCLIQALSGQAPAAADDQGRVTAATLQSYLSREVPRELLLDLGPGVAQSPWQFGALSRDFVIADLSALRTAAPTATATTTRRSYSLEDGRAIEFTLPAGGMTMDQCVRFFLYLMSLVR